MSVLSGFLLDGVTPVRDLKRLLADAIDNEDPEEVDFLAEAVFDDLLDEVVLGVGFDVHQAAKTHVADLAVLTSTPKTASTTSTSVLGVDVFGQVITTASGVPPLKKQPECVCPNCQRNLAASRFAPHLEKCMGMGRNSSRLASRRLLANNNKDNMMDAIDDDAEDEDWIEPELGVGSSSSSSTSNRRKRDKNSPRRTISSGGRKSKSSGESTPTQEVGAVTPPNSYDVLTPEERQQWLATICGVVSMTSRKICSRSTRCPVHSDAQRREVRARWLDGFGLEESHVDIDSFTEGDTLALRESLAQLSNASSPAESTVSTGSTASKTARGRGEKGRGGRGKKKAGSKSASRGSTPPLLE